MSTIYDIRIPDGVTVQPKVYSRPSLSAAELDEHLNVVFAVVEPDSPENADIGSDWIFAEIRFTPLGPGPSGYIETRFLGEVVDDVPMPEVDVGQFVRTCARHEVLYAAGSEAPAADAPPEETPSIAVLADYLIALAEIETEITKYDNSPTEDDLLGPFQHSVQEWSDFLRANPKIPFDDLSRFNPLRHVPCAAYFAENDWQNFAKLAAEAGLVVDDEPYIPSFLSLLHSRLFGVEASFKLLEVKNGPDPQKKVSEFFEEVIPDVQERENLFERRRRFLNPTQTGEDTTVNTLFEHTRGALNDAFKRATSLLKTHFPEFVLPPEETLSPWLATSKEEHALWKSTLIEETTPEGVARIQEYFDSTDHPPVGNSPPAWCGAYASHIMKNCGSDEAAASVVKGSARAANWKTWGDRDLRHGTLGSVSPSILKGAIVVLHAPPDGSSSGHVTIAIGKVPHEDALLCQGGNQSNTVNVEQYGFSRIAAVRVLDTNPQEPEGDDADVLARTLYGEARGESSEGRQAVAMVVMNRVGSARYPNSVRDVCLQKSQFSCWNKNDPNRAKLLSVTAGDSDFDACIAVAADAVAGQINVLPQEVLHYHADTIAAPKWVQNSPAAQVVNHIGHHVFYKGIA